ncbi:DUF2946 domain-containing protein [Rhodanobacter sp. 115]|uniref:DUF2946 domain-containing protein n=1 Tax=Rhodanobacter sp. FW021-MT20 TaxID=1162282 RepID=UPI000260D776|nr:hypothetical protein UU5_20520 [Rhodanobacter sp. 115]
MRGRSCHHRIISWLGLLAITLTIVAPTVSRTLLGEAACSPAPVDTRSAHDGHGEKHSSNVPVAPDMPSSPLDKCGYCGFFVHSPSLGGGVAIVLWPILPKGRLLPAPHLHTPPPHPLLAARSRGPPILTMM